MSVIVPTYNRAHLLQRTLQSVLRQTFSRFELIVVDDGSSDRTREVVGQLADPRIRYIRLPTNRGVAAARNRGMHAAKGEFIAFLDSDDEWMPDKLSLQVAKFRHSPDEVGLTYTGVETVDDRGGRRIDVPAFRGKIYDDLLLRNVIHGCSGVMIRRGVVDVAGYFDEAIPAIEDYDYWVRVARSFDVDFIADILLRYHDPIGVDERKSLNVEENLEARHYFYNKNRKEMRDKGVAHLFLMESARRHRNGPDPDLAGSRLQAVRAALLRPFWWEPYSFLLGTMPEPIRAILREARRLIQWGRQKREENDAS